MASRNIEDCDMRLQRAWDMTIERWDHPCKPFLTCTYRTDMEQADLYSIGRTKPGKIVTYARPGQSKHNLFPSLAFDIAFKNPGGSLNWDRQLFRMFYEIIKRCEPEIIWGGFFRMRDYPHFEVPKITAL